MPSEKQLEAKARELAKARGGLLLKWTAPGTPGVPDRILFMPDRRIEFIEFKSLRGKTTKLQDVLHARLAKLGVTVHVVNSIEAFEAIIDS